MDDHMLQIAIRNMSKWDIPALKNECRRQGIDYRGEKCTLLHRLQQFYENKFKAQQTFQSQQFHSPAAPDRRYMSTAAEHMSGNVDLLQQQSGRSHTADHQSLPDPFPKRQLADSFTPQMSTCPSPAKSSLLDLSMSPPTPERQMELDTSSTTSSLPMSGADRQVFITHRRNQATSSVQFISDLPATSQSPPRLPIPAPRTPFSQRMLSQSVPGLPTPAPRNSLHQRMLSQSESGLPAPATSQFNRETTRQPPLPFNTHLNSSSLAPTQSNTLCSSSADSVQPNITRRRTNIGQTSSRTSNVHFASPYVTSKHLASPLTNRGEGNSSFADHTLVADTSQTLPTSVATYSYPQTAAYTLNLFSNSERQTQPIASSLAQPILWEHNPNQLLSPPSVNQSITDSASQHTPLVTAAPREGNMQTSQSQQSPSQTLLTQLPNAHSTQLHLQASPIEEMNALEQQLKILKMKEEIRNTQHRLDLPLDRSNDPSLIAQSRDNSNSELQTMISYVKRSIDISSTPTAKPMIFNGDPLHYPTWRASFDLLVSEKDITQAQKLTILLSHVSGDAKEWIEYYIMSDSHTVFDDAMQAIEENFGNPFEVADAFRDKLESWPKIGGSDSKGLKRYAQFLKQCKHAMFSNEHLSDLDNPRQFKNFVSCLPTYLVQRWSREAGRNKMKNKKNPSFADYADFVMDEAILACDKTTSYQALSGAKEVKKQPKKDDFRSRPNKAVTHTTNASNTPKPVENKPVKPETTKPVQNKQFKSERPSLHCNHCKTTNSHSTVDCRKIGKMSTFDQQSFMKNESLCFHCLEKNHSKVDCTTDVTCGKCSGKHATCLHRKLNDKPYSSDSTQTKSDSQTSTKLAVTHSINSEAPNSQQVTTMTVPVYISSPEDPTNEILIYALVDSGSNKSYIEQEVCDSLFISKIKRKLRVSTITSQGQISWCDCISNLRVRGLNSSESDVVCVEGLYSLDTIPANKDHIPTPETAARWPHLQSMKEKLSSLQPCKVSMIIGFPCSIASLPLETVKCKEDLTLPYAVRTILGWSIIGGKDSDEVSTITHRITSVDITNDHILKLLEEDLTVPNNKPPMSQNDFKFLDIMDNAITQDDKGFYTMPLPFKQQPDMPDNRAYAMSRFKGLERKLNANPELNRKYREFMGDIISKGEAEEVKEPGTSGWYIPHHGVFHPHKAGKLRVVYDCSSSFKGHSLNKNLLQGPDLNNSLAGLLCRFRKERIAVTCDVRKMFHQFRVSEADRQYLRFLWYRDGSSDIIDFNMNVHLFGATSSPSCAIYGMQRIASDQSSQFPMAAKFVKENFYVDDGLASVATPSEAIQLMKDAREMLANGNLVLHKFLSNNDQVAKELGCDGPATKIISNDQDVDRTLGLCWNVQDDAFNFLEVTPKSPTRRGVLSTVASLFDPLGLLAPFTLTGKLFLQQLCYEKVDWDDPLDDNHMSSWSQWTQNLKDLKRLKINRCYIDPGLSLPYDVELHNFSDACETGYGSCSYLRLINHTTGQVSVSLAFGKSRVAPKKYVSMPRLELQAVTLAVKCNNFLRNELHYDNMTSYFWTDSKAVLGYVTNEVRKFHVFVYNRVQQIRDSSSAEQWNYINTADNPADIVSRGCYLPHIPRSWLNGPDFLHDPLFTPNFNTRKEFELNPDDPEIKRVFAHTAAAEIEENWILAILRKFSTWTKVVRVMKHVVSFISKARKQEANTQTVFNSLIKVIQLEHFHVERQLLLKDEKISKSSPLYPLDPFLDESHVLRVGGRLKNSLASYETRHPIALPSKEILTKVYIRHNHIEAAHQGRTTTINVIRSCGVHIVGGIKAVSSVIYNCVKCKKLRGSPLGQKMADLPTSRVEPSPPFTHTGMDVFGPFVVRDYRKELKRYGLLFTCMASRAIHLELLDNLSTDSFINSMRNFLAIRGPVHTFYSDRGTNFVGAANEFRQCLTIISNPEVHAFMESQQSSFKFNIPYASHMGGTWERMIRIVRQVLQGILIEANTTRLSTSSLRTLFYECMYIVNSRPLTTEQLSTDASIEPQPLTPNCLLTMKTQPLKPPSGQFEEAHMYSRKSWKRIQYLSEQFWSRWKQEYLQALQKRQKWTKEKPNFKEGDIVLLTDKATPRCDWKTSRILKVIPSKDELIRKVELITTTGQIYQRPIHNLILLVRN